MPPTRERSPNQNFLTALRMGVTLSILTASGNAFAYLGPGAGLGMIGSLIAVILVILVVILGLVIYPIRMHRKRKLQMESDAAKGESAG